MQTKQQLRKAIKIARRQTRMMEQAVEELQRDYVISGEEAERVSGYELVMQQIRKQRDGLYKRLR